MPATHDRHEVHMTPLLQLVAWTTVLTWVAIMDAALLHHREWTW
jgi:hypothetical protein